MNRLARTGIMIKGQLVRIRIRRIICDTPTKNLLKRTSGHSSINGCGRCDTVAVKIDDNIVCISVGNARTDEDFRLFADLNHLLDVSPLVALEPSIDMILTFMLDIMHLFYLGIRLRLFQYWNEGEPAVTLSAGQREELNRRTEMLKKDIPYEFKRKMRPTNHYKDYKATDHRFFVKYCGSVVLKKILSNECYDHFLLFHVACRMLSRKKASTHSRLALAQQYLSQFVETFKILYGLKFVSLNVHSLHHVVDDVNSGCDVNDLAASPFKSDLLKAKHLLRSSHNTLAQCSRRIFEERSVIRKSLYAQPCDSSLLNILEIDPKPLTRQSRIITFDGIVTKLVRISINYAKNDPLRTFVFPLLH
ncbi:hypothetical protein QAD02_004827 [Eretmocerus hayati]|uniref:Uncharacterized protein n=1 Tax=Eretmocerus hayati TaxID=131215 RepID=A0ACC2NQT4_9HYME|nr:hypothetical protein QAD02_004827 [Eretmocerus hayati]